jgi:plasmid stability protein
MASLTIKNVPERLVRRLKRQASAHRRSLNLEVIACLEQATQSVPVDPETLLARIRAIRVEPRIPVTDRLLAELKAEGRP